MSEAPAREATVSEGIMQKAHMPESITARQLASILEAKIKQLAPKWLAGEPGLHNRLVEFLADDPEQLLIPPMSYEDFLAWVTDIHTESIHAEWVEDKVLLMSPASSRHQDIVVFLVTLLNLYVRHRNLGRIMTAPFQMRLHQPPRGREPDILFVAQANVGQITKQYLDGPADLVVEVVSPESGGRDRGEKFYEYEIAGIREYWLIDPQREEAEFYQLDTQGRYSVALSGHTGEYESVVISGLRLDLGWLWQDPPPPVPIQS